MRLVGARSIFATLRNRIRRLRRAYAVVAMVFGLSMMMQLVALYYWESSRRILSMAESRAYGYQSQMLALAGFQAALSVLQNLPEDVIFQSGIALRPPDIVMEDCRPECFISYRLIPEDGKLNLNNLVTSADEPSRVYRDIFERFWFQYRLPFDDLDTITDWIDQNDFQEPRGAERERYRALVPPRKIKNYWLFSLPEIGQVYGVDWSRYTTSQAPPGWEEEREELRFLTEDEKTLLTADDWIPANNLTAYIPYDNTSHLKININAARYHTLMSLSDAMNPDAVEALFRLRRQNSNYIGSITELAALPEFQVPASDGRTLYTELAGQGGELSGLITTSSRIWRLVGVGTIHLDTDNRNRPVVRRVDAIYDRAFRRLLYYTED